MMNRAKTFIAARLEALFLTGLLLLLTALPAWAQTQQNAGPRSDLMEFIFINVKPEWGPGS